MHVLPSARRLVDIGPTRGSRVLDPRAPATAARYRFGGRTADFLLCRHCGVYVGAQMIAGDRAFGIINVHALREPPPGRPPAVAMSYDGESASERQQRRMQRWTPVAQAA